MHTSALSWKVEGEARARACARTSYWRLTVFSSLPETDPSPLISSYSSGQVRTCGAFFIVSTIREKCIQYKASLPPTAEEVRTGRLTMLPTASRLPGGDRWPPRP